MPDEFIEPREYRLVSWIIRSAWWCAIGVLLLLPCCVALEYFLPLDYTKRSFGETVLSVVFRLSPLLLASGILVAMAQRWRLRVDDSGLQRRRFLRWDTWLWDDFRRGLIQRGPGVGAYVDERKPWYRRRLTVSYLSTQESEAVAALCLSRWTPPPQNIPASLRLRTPKVGFNRLSLAMAPAGIEITDRQSTRAYNWKDVEHLELTRIEKDHPSFHQLRLTLPDRVIELRIDGSDIQNWWGSSPVEVSAFLKHYVASEFISEVYPRHRPIAKQDLTAAEVVVRRKYELILVLLSLLLVLDLGVLSWHSSQLYDWIHTHPDRPLVSAPSLERVVGIFVTLFAFILPLFIFYWRVYTRMTSWFKNAPSRVDGDDGLIR